MVTCRKLSLDPPLDGTPCTAVSEASAPRLTQRLAPWLAQLASRCVSSFGCPIGVV